MVSSEDILGIAHCWTVVNSRWNVSSSSLLAQLFAGTDLYSLFSDVATYTSRFSHFEKFSLHFSSLSYVIRLNLLHP